MLPSTFPRGRLGAGLLLLRAAFGLVLLTHGVFLLFNQPDSVGTVAAALTAGITGGLLTIGFLTSVAALFSGVFCAATVSTVLPSVYLFSPGAAVFLTGSVAVSIALLGPGAFSADARLFGPREIVIPPASIPDERSKDDLI